MELFSISTLDASKEKISKLYEEIKRELTRLHPHQFGEKINLIIQPTKLCCTAILPQFQLKTDAEAIYEKVSLGIAEYVINEIEHKIVDELIRKEHQIYNDQEIISIEKYCIQMLNGDYEDKGVNDTRHHRKQKLALAFHKYLSQNTYLILEGFIQFRMPQYRDELCEVVEYAIDEFLMEKQYQEFISLLKYFVYVQDTKISEVHIIHKEGNDFVVLNDQLKPVENKKSEGFVVEMIDKDINYEDMIISTLVSISPEKVYIHTRQKETQVIKTIQQIFEDRTVICDDCSICVPVLDKYSLDR
jgi:putative sporulation protein YtxC